MFFEPRTQCSLAFIYIVFSTLRALDVVHCATFAASVRGIFDACEPRPKGVGGLVEKFHPVGSENPHKSLRCSFYAGKAYPEVSFFGAVGTVFWGGLSESSLYICWFEALPDVYPFSLLVLLLALSNTTLNYN